MEKKVVVSKRFRNNTMRVYEYLIEEFSVDVANGFLDRLEKKIEFIASNPEAGKPSVKIKNIRCLHFTPHNQIFYRFNNSNK